MNWWDMFTWGFATGIHEDREYDTDEVVNIDITIDIGEEDGSK